MAADTSVETPSGKSATSENFPVGSFLIEARLRPHIAAFYAFARAIDDIADNPSLSADEKLRRLNGFDRALIGEESGIGFEKAQRLSESLRETGVPATHGRELIDAFRQDATKQRYRDWDDLMAYCRLSAAPVGRYLIDLHGCRDDLYPASDALCAALQVINHLQDAADDFSDLDRVYLPSDWMDEADVVPEDLRSPKASPGVRSVIDRCLGGCRRLINETGALRGGHGSRRLALESAVIIEIANRLIDKLARQDPLAYRVELSKAELLWAGVSGIIRQVAARG